MEDETRFWAEQIAEKISKREKFRFLGRAIPKLKNWSVKTSSSLSGVLHIGRLSDIIRSEAVYKALKGRGFPAEFIYVTEDMDPLRKIPKGVSREFENYIGFPVSDVPDPHGCHESYAKHFLSKFLETFEKFMFFSPKVYSMRDEYKKGNFNDSIIELAKRSEEARGIIERLQGNTLPKEWSPWKPICDSCGNLQTTAVTGLDKTEISYVCSDYKFEKHTAKGCGFEGAANLKKANGKLVWKSEWAAQWKRWAVATEGAGKEYNAPNSAFSVNAEICERILGFPMPEPIFYEHIYIGGQKMSASVGNVIYPHDWLEVSRPESLKYLYMKKINKARSFSWSDIPLLELELDRATDAYFGKSKIADEKQLAQNKNMYEYSRIRNSEVLPLPVDYSLASALAQLFAGNADVLAKLRELGHLAGNESKKELEQTEDRITKARKWSEKYAPDEMKISFAEQPPRELGSPSREMRSALALAADAILKSQNAGKIQEEILNIAKASGVSPRELFSAIYLALIGKRRGPKAGSLILALGRERCAGRLKSV